MQGGSTITQQLIKTRLLGDEPTLTRKIKEAILAIEATRTFSKHQILEMYLNQIFYGNQSYGLKAAAKTYFGVADLNQLTLGQMALLAGLPQAPSAYDPIQNPDAAKARRADVLAAMVDNGHITQSEADAANAEPINVKPATTSLYAPHFTFRVREQIINELGEKAAYAGLHDPHQPRLEHAAARRERGEGPRRRAEGREREQRGAHHDGPDDR